MLFVCRGGIYLLTEYICQSKVFALGDKKKYSLPENAGMIYNGVGVDSNPDCHEKYCGQLSETGLIDSTASSRQ